MTFLKHAQTAWTEGRLEDAAWLREKARERWSQRKTVPEIPSADEVDRAVGRCEGDVRVDAMRLLTFLRVSERGHPVSHEAIMVLVRRLEEML